jgi:hypothetical protein
MHLIEEFTFCFTLVCITLIGENFLRLIVKIYILLTNKVQAFIPVSWICIVFMLFRFRILIRILMPIRIRILPLIFFNYRFSECRHKINF